MSLQIVTLFFSVLATYFIHLIHYTLHAIYVYCIMIIMIFAGFYWKVGLEQTKAKTKTAVLLWQRESWGSGW